MDTINTLDELAQLMDKYGLDEISVDNGEFKAKLSKKPKMPPPPMMSAPSIPAPAVPVVQQINGDVTQSSAPVISGNIIKSPIIGTFYASAAPGKAAFAMVGTKVTKGQTICIVESMKLMNEISSDYDGTVAEIYVKDGSAVEFDQPLMRIE